MIGVDDQHLFTLGAQVGFERRSSAMQTGPSRTLIASNARVFNFFYTVYRRASAKGGASPSRSALCPRSAKMKDAAIVK